jgi:hypothetical protein
MLAVHAHPARLLQRGCTSSYSAMLLTAILIHVPLYGDIRASHWLATAMARRSQPRERDLLLERQSQRPLPVTNHQVWSARRCACHHGKSARDSAKPLLTWTPAYSLHWDLKAARDAIDYCCLR